MYDNNKSFVVNSDFWGNKHNGVDSGVRFLNVLWALYAPEDHTLIIEISIQVIQRVSFLLWT